MRKHWWHTPKDHSSTVTAASATSCIILPPPAISHRATRPRPLPSRFTTSQFSCIQELYIQLTNVLLQPERKKEILFFFYLFRTTHRVKTQQVVKSRGQHCGDIELPGYLANAAGPVPLVLDLRLAHDRFGSSSDPTLNGRLHYNDIDKSLNASPNDKIRKHRTDYNNNPLNDVTFIPAMSGTNGRLHSDFIRLLFLQTHRETDRFFAVSGLQSAQSNLGATCFHFRRAAVLNQQVKMWTATRKDCFFTCYPQFGCRTYRISFSHSPITFTNISVINLVSIFRCSSSKTNSVYVRRVNSLVLGCSPSKTPTPPYIYLLIHNKQTFFMDPRHNKIKIIRLCLHRTDTHI